MALYRELLGERFQLLPPAVQRLHDVRSVATHAGLADVRRGAGWLSRLLATILSFPGAGEGLPLRVTFTRDGAREIWTRRFDAGTFRSVQWGHNSQLYERLRFTTLIFDVDVTATALSLRLRDVIVLGAPVARWLRPEVTALETEEDGRFHFDVCVTLPWLGLLIAYRGHLLPAGDMHA